MRPNLHALPALLALAAIACDTAGGAPAPLPDATATIGAAGGTLSAYDGTLSFSVPPGALDRDAAITVREAPPEVEEVLRAWEFGPDGLTFAPAAQLSVTLDLATLPAGVEPQTLRLAHWIPEEGLALVPAGATAASDAGVLTSPVAHFSQRAVVQYRCEDLNQEPTLSATYQPGDQVALTWASDRSAPLLPAVLEFARVVGDRTAPEGAWLRLQAVAPATGSRTVPIAQLGATWCAVARRLHPDAPCSPDRAALYFFRSRTYCGTAVAGPPSAPVSVAYFGVGRVPDPPASVRAVPVDETQVTVSWAPGDEHATCFEVERDQTLIARVAADTLSVVDSGAPSDVAPTPGCPAVATVPAALAPGQTATYCVRAGNETGWSGASCTAATTPVAGALAAPTDFRAALVGANTVRLSWSPFVSRDGTPVSYLLDRSVDGGAMLPHAALNTSAFSFDDVDVPLGAQLRYQLRATIGLDQSAPVEVAITVPGVTVPVVPGVGVGICDELELRLSPGSVTLAGGQSARVTLHVTRRAGFTGYVYLTPQLADCDGVCDVALAFCDGPGACTSDGAFLDEGEATMELELTPGQGAGFGAWDVVESQHPACKVRLQVMVPAG
ncbi:MAG: hypothetical protein CVU56_23925 [Deltaproteobacteria bacterium HGW-Deltaproteobacteria-14]|jgi:hypothetical protein|nr:MAG: hypothetical protein CVU56_23925 [Deltaproteobacteria bacterium HGW-Deltaproteobacteria-14]